MKFKNGFLYEDGIYYSPSTDIIFALAWSQKTPVPTFYTVDAVGLSSIPLSFTEDTFMDLAIERIGDLEDIETEVLEPEDEEDLDYEDSDIEEELTDEELENVKTKTIKNNGDDNIN